MTGDSRNKTLLQVFGKHSADPRTGEFPPFIEPDRKPGGLLFDAHSSAALKQRLTLQRSYGLKENGFDNRISMVYRIVGPRHERMMRDHGSPQFMRF